MEQEIDLATFSGTPASLEGLGALLTSTGDANAASVSYEGCQIVFIHNPTTSVASIKVKVSTENFAYLSDFGFTIADRTFSVPAGETHFLVPTAIYADENGLMKISSDQLVRIIPIGQWTRG